MSSNTSGAFESETVSTRLDHPLTLFTVVYWGFIIAYAASLWIPRPQYAVVFVGGSMIIYVLNEATKELANDDRWALAVLIAVGVATVVATAYVTVFFWDLFYHRPGVHYTHEYVIAVAMMASVVYLTYRSFGVAFVIVAGIAMLYGLGGQHLPGLFGHSGLSPTRLADIWVLNISGFYGSITRIIAAWVSLFLLYTGLVRAFGAFDLILRLVFIGATKFRSGVAQFAVLASMLIGSINGSPSANTAMTGSFTIPMMKESGMPSDTAASVEASASSGGQIMPPVMGSAAFVMASLLGITYLEVLVAGLVPAAIFIVTVGIGVHYATLRNVPEGLTPEVTWEAEEPRSRWRLVFDGVKFLLPFAVLIYTLGVAQWTVMTAALVTVLAQLITGLGFPAIESAYDNRGAGKLPSVFRSTCGDMVDGFRYGAIILAPIAIIIALINGIVDIVQATGLPGALTLALMDITGGSLLVAALMAMVICIILGMGMPSVAAYTIVAILVAPTFVEAFLVEELAAHYFVFYSAVLAFITPPIATAAVVASGVAGSNFWRTCLAAIRISIVLFILPIVFLYNPILLVDGLTAGTFLVASIVMLGAVSVTHGINYPDSWGPRRVVDAVIRLVYVALGLVIMIYPNLVLSLGLIAVAGGMFAVQYLATIRTSIDRLLREQVT